MTKICSDSLTLPFQCPVAMHYCEDTFLEHMLQLLFHKLSLEVMHHGSRSTLGPGPSKT